GKEQSIKITASSGLTEEEIKKMIRDAETHAAEDKNKKELIEAKNNADSVCYSVEKSLNEYGDKISEAEREEIKRAIEKCRKLKDESSNAGEIKAATEELTKVSYKLAEQMYKNVNPNQASGGGSQQSQSKPKQEEDVVDAEFEDVDKNKK
ncbi:MAG: Hsp70 family protein, partial [Thermodesulfovibrionales bacterium]|nr:Hsp70 family protein [Thermodesulfovibrionales bacterium]